MQVLLVRAALVTLLLMALLPSPSGAAPLAGNHFQSSSVQLYLTGDAGEHGLVLGLEPGAEGTTMFLLPGMDAAGLVRQADSESWTSTTAWPKDMEVTKDSVVHLVFSANVQALAVFRVRLLDIAPDGTAVELAQDEAQFITALSPQPQLFHLALEGSVLPAGHRTRLTVEAETLQAAVLMTYGGDTPAALDAVTTRFLDSDGDGYADTDEVAAGTNPLDPRDHDGTGRDRDGDGLTDGFETAIGTDPLRADTDGDGFGDGLEVHAGTHPREAASRPYDGDADGLPDVFETNHFATTNIHSPGGVPGVGGSDDPDGDGCDNACEAAHGTDPNDADSDDDGVLDGDEVSGGTSPTIAGPPGARGIPEPIAAAAMFAVGTTIPFLALMRRP